MSRRIWSLFSSSDWLAHAMILSKTEGKESFDNSLSNVLTSLQESLGDSCVTAEGGSICTVRPWSSEGTGAAAEGTCTKHPSSSSAISSSGGTFTSSETSPLSGASPSTKTASGGASSLSGSSSSGETRHSVSAGSPSWDIVVTSKWTRLEGEGGAGDAGTELATPFALEGTSTTGASEVACRGGRGTSQIVQVKQRQSVHDRQ